MQQKIGFRHPSSRTPVTLYNALAGGYNRLRDERPHRSSLPHCFSPFQLEGPHTAQPSYVSREGLERLKSELEELRTVLRQEAADRIQQSLELGGVESNAEYEYSKNELAFIEGRILTLDSMINNAVIIQEGSGSGDTVEVENTIAVKDQDGRSIGYTIVGSTEADPSQGKISNVSPIGKSLLGKRIGEIAEVDVPSGKIRLEVIAIE